MNLSIIIPCKNEAENITACLQRVTDVCPGAEILVVGSAEDDTKKIVNQLNRMNPSLSYIDCIPDRGKGDAIRTGIQRASRSVILQMDADLQFFPEDIPSLIQPILENKADMILGSRFLKLSDETVRVGSWIRSLGNICFSLYTTCLYGQKISDALAGFKAWKREVTESFFLTSVTFTYEIELFACALRKGWRVQDVPVRYTSRVMGESKVPLFKTGLRILKDALYFRFRKL